MGRNKMKLFNRLKRNSKRISALLFAVSLGLCSQLNADVIELPAQQWQLVSFPKLSDGATVESVFGDAASNGQLTAVWTFNNSDKKWQSWPAKTGLVSSDLSELSLGQGYWVKTQVDLTIDLPSESQSISEMVLYPGWNLIGLSLDQAISHEKALAGVPFLELWKFDSQQNKFLTVEKSSGSQIILKEEFANVDAGEGLWVYMSEQSTLLPQMGTLLPPDIDVEPLLNITEYGIEKLWDGYQMGADVDWDGDNHFDFPNTQTQIAFGDFLNRQQMSITNEGNGVLSWSAHISSDTPWLKFETLDENNESTFSSTISGVTADLSSSITLFADRVGKASGSENLATINITANGGVARKVINVSMHVADIIGDYEVNIGFETIDSEFADLHNPKYFLSLARDGDGIKAFLDEERSLLIPTTTYLSGSYAGDPASNFQILGQITQDANDEANPFGKTIRRTISYVGRRSDGLDGLSPLDLKGEYYENIYGVFEEPIQLKGSFIATRLSPLPVKQDSSENTVKNLVIEAATELQSSVLLADLEIQERLSVTEVIAKLEIEHSLPQALTISLLGPMQDGLRTEVLLHDKQDRSIKSLSFDDEDISIDSMALFKDRRQLSQGTWTLKIENNSTSVGELLNWNLLVNGAKVYEITGSVAPGVRLKLSGCGITQTVTSDSDGNFVFDGLIPCDYEITVSQLGYEATTTSVTLLGCLEGQDCQYSVPLSLEQIAELEPQLITTNDGMKVIISPKDSILSNNPAQPIRLNGLDVTNYSNLSVSLVERHWQLYKRVNSWSSIDSRGYLVDVSSSGNQVPPGNNYFSYSEEFSQWNPSNSVLLTKYPQFDPRGGYGGVSAVTNGSSSASIFSSNNIGQGAINVNKDDVLTFSVFLKAGSTSQASFRFASENGPISFEVFDFTTGIHVAGQDLASNVQVLANGWVRASVTLQAQANYNGFYVELLIASDGNDVAPASGAAFEVFGPQLERHDQALTMDSIDEDDLTIYLSLANRAGYIATDASHGVRSNDSQIDVLISEQTSTAPNWVYDVNDKAANAGIYYLVLNSAVKNAGNVSSTLSYTTADISLVYANLNQLHFGVTTVNGAAGSTAMKAMDSATFDIDRPTVGEFNPITDSNHFNSELNPATQTNSVGDVSDNQFDEPVGDPKNHYRIFVTTGQLFQTGSMYGGSGRLDVGVQSQEANK